MLTVNQFVVCDLTVKDDWVEALSGNLQFKLFNQSTRSAPLNPLPSIQLNPVLTKRPK
jgi:hypothetical protein